MYFRKGLCRLNEANFLMSSIFPAFEWPSRSGSFSPSLYLAGNPICKSGYTQKVMPADQILPREAPEAFPRPEIRAECLERMLQPAAAASSEASEAELREWRATPPREPLSGYKRHQTAHFSGRRRLFRQIFQSNYKQEFPLNLATSPAMNSS